MQRNCSIFHRGRSTPGAGAAQLTSHRAAAAESSRSSHTGRTNKHNAPPPPPLPPPHADTCSRRDAAIPTPLPSATTTPTAGHRSARSIANTLDCASGGSTNTDRRSNPSPPQRSTTCGVGQHRRPIHTTALPLLRTSSRPTGATTGRPTGATAGRPRPAVLSPSSLPPLKSPISNLKSPISPPLPSLPHSPPLPDNHEEDSLFTSSPRHLFTSTPHPLPSPPAAHATTHNGGTHTRSPPIPATPNHSCTTPRASRGPPGAIDTPKSGDSPPQSRPKTRATSSLSRARSARDGPAIVRTMTGYCTNEPRARPTSHTITQQTSPLLSNPHHHTGTFRRGAAGQPQRLEPATAPRRAGSASPPTRRTPRPRRAAQTCGRSLANHMMHALAEMDRGQGGGSNFNGRRRGSSRLIRKRQRPQPPRSGNRPRHAPQE